MCWVEEKEAKLNCFFLNQSIGWEQFASALLGDVSKENNCGPAASERSGSHGNNPRLEKTIVGS